MGRVGADYNGCCTGLRLLRKPSADRASGALAGTCMQKTAL